MKRTNFRFRRRASSLIISLLVIVILSTIVVAFMQSMAVERLVAKSSLNVYRARLAADSGVKVGAETIRDLFRLYPDSATAWATNMAPASLSTVRTPGTAFYYYDEVTVTNKVTTLTNVLFYRPLVSGAQAVPFASRATALSSNANATNYVNLNTAAFGGGRPWIGAPPSTTNPTTYRIDVPWVEIRDDNGKVVARYAYWIDDESFRVNLNLATNNPRGTDSLGLGPAEIPLTGVLKASSASPTLAGNIASTRSQAASLGGLFKLRNINFADTSHPGLSDTLGFISTVSSSGLNISRTGARRLNLNGVVGTNTSPTNSLAIETELRKITSAITNQAPLFGQRFFRSVSAINARNTTDAEAELYLTKLAANIRDYLDTDSQPTVVESGGSVYAGGVPSLAIASGEVSAVGKENVPRLQEAMLHVRQGNMSAAGSPNSPFDMRLSYFFEFWNMGTTDITLANLESSPLANDAFLGVSDQPAWRDAGANSGAGAIVIPRSPSRDFKIPLRDFEDAAGNPVVFRAGQVTVITTETDPQNSAGSLYNAATGTSFYRPKASAAAQFNLPPHRYASSTTYGNLSTNSVAGYSGLPTLVVEGRDGTVVAPSSSESNVDCQTEVYLGNGAGWIDSQKSAVVIRPGIYLDGIDGNAKANRANFHWRGGALMGNVNAPYTSRNGTPYQVGDPRAANEQIVFTDPGDQQRWQTAFERVRDTAGARNSGGFRSSLGQPNAFFTLPQGGAQQWDEGNNDRTTNSLSAGGSPAFVRNGTMSSIGELGHIYDPIRIITSTADKDHTAGGSRTLRLGRPESVTSSSGLILYDTNATSLSRRWTAWRLADIFSVKDDPGQNPAAQPEGIPGLINPNGALRDGGAAFLAALDGYAYSTDDTLTDFRVKGSSFGTNVSSAFRNYLTNWMNAGVPFFERGEISELTVFNLNIASMLTPNPGVSMVTLNDRGREEVFRRMAEMITTKGNTFTIYVVGQAVTDLPSGVRRVEATQTRKVTVRAEPMYQSSSLDFNPLDASAVQSRFASPTNYALRVLSQTDN